MYEYLNEKELPKVTQAKMMIFLYESNVLTNIQSLINVGCIINTFLNLNKSDRAENIYSIQYFYAVSNN